MLKDLDYRAINFIETTQASQDSFTHYLHLIKAQEIHTIQLLFSENITKTIKIAISYNKTHYIPLQEFCANGKLHRVKNTFRGNIAAIKVKILKGRLRDMQNIEILSKAYNRLIIAARSDGIGARMITLLNTIYLSNLLGGQTKFGFVWKNDFLSNNLNPMRNKNEIEGNKIAGLGLEGEEAIFTQEFIQQFSYTNSLGVYNGSYPKGNNLQEFLQLSIEATTTKDCFFLSIPTPLYEIFKEIQECEYRKGLREIWDTLEFTPKLKNIINTAKKIALQNQDFIAIHIRSGDVIFIPEYRNNLDRMFAHTLPLELAIACIEMELKANHKVVLFSDDFSSMEILLRWFKNHKLLYSIQSLIPANLDLNNLERVFFEITFMSFADKIYTSKTSVYARLSHYIGNNSVLINTYEVFDKQTQYQLLQQYTITPHRFQRALSSFYKFVLSRDLNLNYTIQQTHIKACMEADKENLLYKMLYIDLLLETKRHYQANESLEDIISNHHSSFITMLSQPNHTAQREKYLKISLEYHNIATIASALKPFIPVPNKVPIPPNP
ncbi:hypothetical protein [Helicobacter apodemus]|uniref:Sugar transferase n=1 Tax=Helicobacter apodemus TaxID=135569 RepID=A0A2U8FBZ9_9HELI|nr:hypothetical protein [Helicobacter apodemus]AWI33752.1 hypothetical protein CDV25_02495 [Helicobacter apodemus]